MGRDKDAPLSQEQFYNLLDLLPRINLIRFHYKRPMVVSSGYRPPAINAQAGGASNSAHLTCQAVDFKDENGDLMRWCLANVFLLEQAGLYMENPNYTLGWVHLQSRPTKSRVFNP